MLKLGAALITAVSGGFVAGFMVAESPSEPPSELPAVLPDTSAAVYFDETAPIDDRLVELERVVAEERDARLVLEDQIAALIDEIDRIDASGPAVIASEVGELVAQRQRSEERAANGRRNRDPAQRAANFRDRQLDRLTAGGFAVDEAEQLLDRRSELQWELMQSQYEARRDGTTVDPRGLDRNLEWQFRQELGDSEYERYLEAMRQPSQVVVSSVFASSPASRIGLQPGDQILAYNGRRVFNTRELNAFTSSGEDAVIDVMRNGTRLQLSVPAGPIGVQVRGSRSPGNGN